MSRLIGTEPGEMEFMQINDARDERLFNSGYTSLRAWLVVATGETAGTNNDLFMLYLNGKGFTGQLNDALHEWLTSLGYIQGHITDQWMDFWTDVDTPMPI